MVQREEEGVQEEGEEEQRRFDISKQTRFKLVITHRCSFSAETPGFTGRRHEMLWQRPFEVRNHPFALSQIKALLFLYSCLLLWLFKIWRGFSPAADWSLGVMEGGGTNQSLFFEAQINNLTQEGSARSQTSQTLVFSSSYLSLMASDCRDNLPFRSSKWGSNVRKVDGKKFKHFCLRTIQICCVFVCVLFFF